MKKIILLLVPLLLCGCEAEYNLIIDGNKISEVLNVKESRSNINNSVGYMTYKEAIDDKLNSNIQISKNEPEYLDDYGTINPNAKFYNKAFINDENYYGISLNYNFSYNDFKESYIINSCPENVNFLVDGSNTIINTSSISSCFNKFDNLDKIIITINIKNKVINSNATSVEGNMYKWEINRGYDDLIYIEYKSSLLSNEDRNNENKTSNFWKTNWKIILMIFIGLSLVGLFVFNSIMQKNKMNNRL